MRGKPKKGFLRHLNQILSELLQVLKIRATGRKDFFDPLRPRFPGAKRTETGWADGVFLPHAGRKDFFDTLKEERGWRVF